MDWLWKVLIGCDGVEEVALRRPSDILDCSGFFRSPFVGVDMVPLPLLVRDVDDEPEFVATSGAVGRSSMSRLAAPVVASHLVWLAIASKEATSLTWMGP